MEESKHPYIHDIVQSCAELFITLHYVQYVFT